MTGGGPAESLPELRLALAAGERDEEWAFLRLLAWLGLLAFVLFVLVFSPVPWGALLGLVLWALGARSVYVSFSEAVERTRTLKARIDELERREGPDRPTAG